MTLKWEEVPTSWDYGTRLTDRDVRAATRDSLVIDLIKQADSYMVRRNPFNDEIQIHLRRMRK